MTHQMSINRIPFPFYQGLVSLGFKYLIELNCECVFAFFPCSLTTLERILPLLCIQLTMSLMSL